MCVCRYMEESTEREQVLHLRGVTRVLGIQVDFLQNASTVMHPEAGILPAFVLLFFKSKMM